MKTSAKLILVATLALGFIRSASAAVETYEIDPVHSTVNFSLRHIVSKFTGSFGKVSGGLTVDRADLEKSTVEAVVDIASINTADEKRNTHVKSPDFFDVAKYTKGAFKSTAWKKTGEDTFDVTGNLTLKDVTKPVTLKVKLLGFGDGMRGAKLSGWEVTGAIKKSDFGLSGPAMLSKALGDEVTLSIGVEAVLKS
ncbi:MAG: polyisoprenoid-binding protein [Undibacterium sp.]|nr:polyisoprenoid-binding protein [Opitutaceae bacterium]